MNYTAAIEKLNEDIQAMRKDIARLQAKLDDNLEVLGRMKALRVLTGHVSKYPAQIVSELNDPRSLNLQLDFLSSKGISTGQRGDIKKAVMSILNENSEIYYTLKDLHGLTETRLGRSLTSNSIYVTLKRATQEGQVIYNPVNGYKAV
jgi:hypothetical protein